MKSYLKVPVLSTFIALFAFALSISVQAQSVDKASNDDQAATERHELIKYEKTYSLEQEENQESLASTVSGIEKKSPNNVFLAQNIITTELTDLQEAEVEKPGEAQEEYEYAYSGTFQSSDVAFTGGSGDDNDSGATFTGRAGPGCGGGFSF